MRRVPETGPPRLVGSRMILQLLAAGRQVRTLVGRPTRANQAPAMRDGGAVRLPAGSFITPERDYDAGRLDVVAGCEFVDDRIRLPE